MKIPKSVKILFDLYIDAGYELYIIGGAVRDYLLNKEIKEFDFTTNALPTESIEILKDYDVNLYNSYLGAIKVKIEDDLFEITTMRKESGVKDLRYPVRIEFTNSIKEDVLRRDFTINQIAYNIRCGFLDCLGGINDLEKKVIKFIGDVKKRIEEDPVRILRGIRFAHHLGFKIDENDYQQMCKDASCVSKLKQIRFDELFKLFQEPNSLSFIMAEKQIICDAFPELNFAKIGSLNLYHQPEKKDLRILFFVLFDKEFIKGLLNNFGLSKKEYKLVNYLLDYEYIDVNLYQTKLLMIKYQELFAELHEVIAFINLDYVIRVKSFVSEIVTKKMCLNKSDLNITYFDLLACGVPKEKVSKALNYLLNKVLEDDSYNQKDILLSLIKNKEFS